MFLSMISLVVAEFKYSKWVDVLEKLIRIKDEEERDYDVCLRTFFFFFLIIDVVSNLTYYTGSISMV